MQRIAQCCFVVVFLLVVAASVQAGHSATPGTDIQKEAKILRVSLLPGEPGVWLQVEHKGGRFMLQVPRKNYGKIKHPKDGGCVKVWVHYISGGYPTIWVLDRKLSPCSPKRGKP